MDPQFVNETIHDYNLQASSPCIGTGRYGDDRGALSFPTSVDDDYQTPASFELLANYPNPFNAQTKIQYSLGKPGMVSITVYDILGREIEEVLNQYQNVGYHSLILNAEGMTSGVYYYRVTSGDNKQTRSMTLIR